MSRLRIGVVAVSVGVATLAPTTAAFATPHVTAVVTAGASHRVVRGDTLWGLSRRALTNAGAAHTAHNVAVYERSLYAANRRVIGANPNMLRIGEVLRMPAVVHTPTLGAAGGGAS